MSVEYQNSILWRGEDPLTRKNQPKVDASKKVIRYFPGQAPKWAKEEEKKKEAEEKRRLEEEKAREAKGSKRRRRDRDAAAGSAAVILEQREDAAATRLRRLRESSGAATVGTTSDRLARHRVIHEARVLEAQAEEDEDEEAKKEDDEEKVAKLEPLDVRGGGSGSLGVAELQIPMYDDISGDDADDVELRTLRRERAREAALVRRKEEEEVLKEELGEEAELEEEDDESSYESDSEDDPRRGARMKPVFVSKTQRETVKEKEILLQQEEAAKERETARKKEKKVESKSLLVDTVRADDEAEAAGVNDENDRSDIELIDDDDEKNEAEEYELWKIRELKRIKRDKEERQARQDEYELIEKRRRMTDQEREEDDRRMDAKASKRDEVKAFGFLQKYYHRGGFFQDKATTGEEPLYNRDYHEPLEEEKFDKQLLPKAMQLRRGQFGKKGQVKHTHLTESDTTDMSAAWAQHSKSVQKYQERMAGASGVNNFSRPTGSSSSRAPG